ncbi:helix-turn-helix domain-containing protein [Kitasatospora sp. NPDC089509]|uniref:helix-turn-helix domain-containing protein n=1 Tax=Kitasatospora sp. NPDC089509 TaxID=3364079 RepID=UPI0037FAF666
MPDVGPLLRRWRLRAGLTQEELAERSGLSSRAIRDLERGRVRRPRLSTVRLLAEAMGLTEQERTQLSEAARPVDPVADSRSSDRMQPVNPTVCRVDRLFCCLRRWIAPHGFVGRAAFLPSRVGCVGAGVVSVSRGRPQHRPGRRCGCRVRGRGERKSRGNESLPSSRGAGNRPARSGCSNSGRISSPGTVPDEASIPT